MKAIAIAGVNLRRLLRDRVGLFFIFVFPIVVIVTIGAVFGGGASSRLGVVVGDGGPLQGELVQGLRALDDVEVEVVADRGTLLPAVERGQFEGGLFIPSGYDSTLRSGEAAALGFIGRPGSIAAQSLRSGIDLVAAQQGALVRAATFATERGEGNFDENLTRARTIAGQVPRVGVEFAYAGDAAVDEDLGAFDFGAAQQLILFMFLTSLNAAAQLIQSRRLRVSQRMVSTPTSVRTVLAGETLGRFGVAMLQGLFIVIASALAFGVKWGNPWGTGAIVILFALVGTGAAMLLGSIFENDQQAGAIGTFLGLALAALGGCMVPLEEFSPTMERVAHVTPHAWAVDGLFDVLLNNAGIGGITTELGALAAFAILLLGTATWRLNRSLVG